ncbi:MAG: hypothetical protein ACK2UB_11790, partial [Anaerolineales bacterium]
EIRACLGGALRSMGDRDGSQREFRRAVELQEAVVERDERYNRATLDRDRADLRRYEGFVSECEKEQ